MDSLTIDENNNLVVAQNNLTIVKGLNAIAQNVKTRIGLYKGEDPLNLERGIDFDNVALGKTASKDYLKDLIRERILDTEDGINTVSLLTIDKIKDKLEIRAEIQSSYGEVKI